jgi:type II secretory pathway pseudopilin PulG
MKTKYILAVMVAILIIGGIGAIVTTYFNNKTAREQELKPDIKWYIT